jgi:hypothetical protein
MASYPRLDEIEQSLARALQLPLPLADINDEVIRSVRDVVRGGNFSSRDVSSGILQKQALPPYLMAVPAPRFEEVPLPIEVTSNAIELNLAELNSMMASTKILRDRWLSVAGDATETIIQLRHYFRNINIKNKEIDEGLYRIPADDANARLVKHNFAQQANNNARSPINSLYQDATSPETTNAHTPLAKLSVGMFNIADASTGAIGDGSKAGLGIQSRQLLWQKWALEKLGWDLQKLDRDLLWEHLKIDIERATVARDYAAKDVAFKVLRDLADELSSIERMEALMAPGGPIDYPAQLIGIRKEIFQLWTMMTPRILQLEIGVQQVYSVTTVCPRPQNFLDIDALSLWMATLDELIQLKKRIEHPVSVVISLKNKNGSGNLAEKLMSGLVFNLAEGDTFDKSVLLRGINVTFVTRGAMYGKMILKAPHSEVFRFGSVQNSKAFSYEVKVLYSDRLWNLKPYGNWEVRSADQYQADEVEDVFIHLFGVFA